MQSFSDYLEHVHKPKVWHAKKDEIIEMWKNLKPTPLVMTPIPENQKGTRLKNDGIRITGSSSFVNSVLSRLKDLIAYDTNPGTRLNLEYRQIDPGPMGAMGQQSFLCYIHTEQDLKKKNPMEKLIKKILPVSKEKS